MTDLKGTDFFRSGRLIRDPYPYFDAIRDECPVFQERNEGVWMVTGFEEAMAVYRDTKTFSSCNSVTGPFPGFPVPLKSDDVSELIEAHRHELPFSDQLPAFDPPKHTAHRGLLMRLLTPRRLKENEDAMWGLAQRQIDEFASAGRCEFVGDFASTFAMLVIADLLGVPESDYQRFREQLAGPTSHGTPGVEHTPLGFLYDTFRAYIEDRRATPRNDVLSHLAAATFPDGSTPTVEDVMLVAANLFAAGQETTVRLLAFSLQKIAEDAELQELLRDDGSRISDFIEEALRYESPIKGDFRLSRVATTIGGVEIPAGSTVMILNAAANRDPRRFESPGEFRPGRPEGRLHLAFGHGIHFCVGAPLARAEGRITVESMLDRAENIRISDEHHGPADARKYRYAPTYMLRGLQELHLAFDPVQGRN